jgi:MtrB/PioB family decaheme-associated outer membrane protein
MSAGLRCTLLLALAIAGAGHAQDPPAPGPDTSAWPCRFCTVENGTSGWLEPRIGYVSDDSFRFGDYTGLDEHGLLLDVSAQWRSRDAATAQFWNASVDRLGLDSRALSVGFGQQGAYGLALGYDVLPHYVARDSQTVFAGQEALTLPAGWTRAGSTAGMPALEASLHPAWLRQERERTALRIDLLPTRATDLRFDYRRDHIRGTAATGASFMTLATQLPRAIDQTLDRADAALALRHALGHAQLAFNSSFFQNDHAALAWQNPYTGPAAGSTRGQLAQAPDNSALRIGLTLASAPAGGPLQASAQLAVGRLDQDARFLPATVNPDESAALPRESLDGRVDTRFGSVRVVYAIRPGTRLLADALHDKRDNLTPVAAYSQVVMDTFTGATRLNTPYGFRRDRWRLSVEDRSVSQLRLGLGVEDDVRERRLYGSSRTDELRYWGRVGWRPLAGSDVRLRLSHAERDGAEIVAGPAAPTQNPLLRSYQTADRDRDEARADLSYGQGTVTTSFNLIYARDQFPGTVVGRTGGDEFGYGADVTAQPAAGWSVSAFASRHLLDTEQAGSQGFGVPDWLAEQEDATNTVGMHVDWQAPRGFDFGADYLYSGSEGSIVMAAGSGETAFPLLMTRWHDARLFGRYALRPNLALRLDLVRERYESRDWSLDGVGADTAPNLLWLGQGTQSGAVTAVFLGLRYEFRDEPASD